MKETPWKVLLHLNLHVADLYLISNTCGDFSKIFSVDIPRHNFVEEVFFVDLTSSYTFVCSGYDATLMKQDDSQFSSSYPGLQGDVCS